MSSTLAVHPGSQPFDLARPQSSASGYSGDHLSHTADVYAQGTQSWFQGGLPTPPGTKDMTGVSLSSSNRINSYPSHSAHSYKAHSRIPSDSYSNSKQVSAKQSSIYDEKTKISAIASHLQIPESVNKSKGSLAEFAAEITCLFWFESAATLEYAETLPIEALPDRGLTPDATPTFGFKKWVTTILSTTQVGKNVILLALMFIYRLKKFNPSVSGKRGSEFRLLTIALMLGNKFLDDNTYTNKTWAEVSGISVTEIHIMEVEFLSNMRYELYASESDWCHWKTLLGKFGHFYEKALKFQLQTMDEQKHNPPITPTSQTFGYKLPSPPSGQLKPVNSSNYGALPNPMSTLPQLPRSPVRQYFSSGISSERKRSIDQSEGLPPAKRFHQATTFSNVPSPVSLSPSSGLQPELHPLPYVSNHIAGFNGSRIPQLPMPRLPPSTNGSTTSLAPLVLPSARAMGSVYPATTNSIAWSQPITPVTTMPPATHGQYQTSTGPVPEGYRSNTVSAHTSPVNLYGSSTPTRPGLSPSYFLTNRSSPYRPVRHVNTLLIPPPSAAMQNPVRNVGYEQMHYQPIGRPSERRSGPVPCYQQDGWNPSNVSTPTTTNLYRPF